MPARAASVAVSDVDPEPISNTCGAQVAAMDRQAQATEALAAAGLKLAKSIEDATKVLKPAADGIHGLMVAQQKLCDFLVGHRLKLAASIPVVLVSVGAISPNAARMLSEALMHLGWAK